MITNRPIWQDDFVRWLFTDVRSMHVRRTLAVLYGSKQSGRISEEFYNHYCFMFNIKLKKLKLLETLDR